MISLPQACIAVLIAIMVALAGLALIVRPVLAQETPAQQNATGTITVTGTPQVGEPLTATDSGVEDADGLPAQEEWSYQWQSSTNGTEWNDIAGATSKKYSPGNEDAGRLLKVQMSFTDNGGNAEALTSDAAADAVLTREAVWTTVLTVGELVTNNIIGRTTYTGWKSHGATIPEGGITDTTFSHNGHDFSLSDLYVWELQGEGAVLVMTLHTGGEGDENSRSTLTLKAAPNGEEDTFALAGKTPEYTQVDQPKEIKWTYNDHGWSKGDTVLISITSQTATEQVAASGKIEFAGDAVVNSQLTAVPTGVSDANGLPDLVEYAYRWERSDNAENWNEIDGATSAAYTPTPADAGHLLRVEATFEDSQNNTEVLTATVIDTDETADPRPEAVKPEGALWAAVLAPGTDATGTDDRHGWDASTGTLTDQGFYYNDSNINSNYFLSGLWEDPANKTLRLSFVDADSGNARDRATLMLLAGPDNDQRQFRLQDAAVDATNGNDVHMTWDEEDIEWAGNALGWSAGTNVLLQMVQMEYNISSWGTVTITGSPYPGETLTAEVTEVGDGNGLPDNVTYEWQWQSLDAQGMKQDIENATSSSYEVMPDDNGKELLARATFTDALRYEEELVSARIPVQADATGTVTVTGTGQVGTDLTTAIGDDITDPNGMPDNPVYTYQWQTSDDGENWSDMADATGSTYQPRDADAGMLARVIVSFNDDEENEESLTSTPSTNAMRPADALFAAIVTVNNVNTQYHLAWISEERLLIDEEWTTGPITDISFDYNGKTWTPQYLQVPNESATEGAFTSAIMLELEVEEAYQAEDWNNLRLDVVGGTQDLTFYLRDGKPKFLDALQVHRFQYGGIPITWQKDDKVLFVISEVPADQPATGNVTITGTPQVGETLTASATGVTDGNGVPDDVTYSYQWQRSNDGAEWTNIGEVAGETYVLTADDLGRLIRAQASFRDSDGWEATLESQATADAVTADAASWAAVLTAGEEHGQLGWIGIGARYGSISDNAFSLDGVDYELTYLLHNPILENLILEFALGKAGTEETRKTLTLHLGAGAEEQLLNFKEAAEGTVGRYTTVTWTGDDIPTWTNGQVILVQIKAIGQQPATGSPTVTGELTIGTELTADTSGISDPNGMPETPAWTYQWQRSDDGAAWTDITGGAASSYTAADEDAGMVLRVNVSFLDSGENTEEMSSEPTADAVRPAGALWAAIVTLSGDQTSNTHTGWAKTGTFADGKISDATFDVGEHTYETGHLALPLTTVTQADRTVVHEFADGSIGINPVRDKLRLNIGSGEDQVSLNLEHASYSGITGGNLQGQWQNIARGWSSGDRVLVTMSERPANQRPAGQVTLSGSAQVGRPLTATTADLADGNGLNDPPGETYQWQKAPWYDRDRTAAYTDIDGATSATYTPVEADEYHHIRAKISFQDLDGYTENLTSARTPEYVTPAGAIWSTYFFTQHGQAPLTNAHGFGTLFTGSYAGSQQFSYRGGTFNINRTYTQTSPNQIAFEVWPETGSDMTDLESLTLKISNGREFHFKDSTSTSAEGTAQRYEWQTPGFQFADNQAHFMSLLQLQTEATGTVTVSGTARENQVLTATIGDDVDDADGMARPTVYRYQWQRSDDGVTWTDIEGATAGTYTVQAEDASKTLRVQVSFNDALGNTETLYSQTTGTASGTVTAEGDTIIGSTLTANVGDDIVDPNGMPQNPAYTYQWQRSDDNRSWNDMDGATAASYESTAQDLGMLLRVNISFTDNDGNTETVKGQPSGGEGGRETIRPEGALIATFIEVNNSQNGNRRGALTKGQLLDNTLFYDGKSITIEEMHITTGAGDATLTIKMREAFRSGENLQTIQDREDSIRDNLRLITGTGTGQKAINFKKMSEITYSSNAFNTTYTVVWTGHNPGWTTGTNALIQIWELAQDQDATGMVEVTGEAVIGSSLTASEPSGVTDPNGVRDNPTHTHQWQRSDNGADWTDVAQADSQTYEVQEEDLGMLLRAIASFEDLLGYDEQVTSAPAQNAVRSSDDVWTAILTVAGATSSNRGWSAQGQPEDGTITDHTFTYNGQEYELTRAVRVRPGGEANKLVLQFALGKEGTQDDRDNLVLTVTDDAGSRAFHMQEATRFAQDNQQVDTNWTWQAPDWEPGDQVVLTIMELQEDQPATASLTLTGMVRVNETLTATLASVTDPNGLAADTQYSYQWQHTNDDGAWTDIDGQTETTYTATAEDTGRLLRMSVTFQDRFGYQEIMVSEATVPVAGVTPPVMVEESVYIIWSQGGTDTVTGYQILRRVLDSGSEFTVLVEDTGNTQTFHRDDTAETGGEYEYAVRAITAQGLSPLSNSVIGMRMRSNAPATGNPAIQGTPKGGHGLSADVSSIEDANGIAPDSFHYEWLVNDGATETTVNKGYAAKSYAPHDRDAGKTIRLRVTFKDQDGYSESLTSLPTAPVEEGDLWKATLSTGEYTHGSGTFHGFSRLGVTVGELAHNVFQVNGENIEVLTLGHYNGADDGLMFVARGEMPADYVLSIGESTFAIRDAQKTDLTNLGSVYNYTWARNGFALTPGQVVDVEMEDSQD